MHSLAHHDATLQMWVSTLTQKLSDDIDCWGNKTKDVLTLRFIVKHKSQPRGSVTSLWETWAWHCPRWPWCHHDQSGHCQDLNKVQRAQCHTIVFIVLVFWGAAVVLMLFSCLWWWSSGASSGLQQCSPSTKLVYLYPVGKYFNPSPARHGWGCRCNRRTMSDHQQTRPRRSPGEARLWRCQGSRA